MSKKWNVISHFLNVGDEKVLSKEIVDMSESSIGAV
jgi:hypothetical protein